MRFADLDQISLHDQALLVQDPDGIADRIVMNRRFFNRVDVKAIGELVWATRSRLGRVKTHCEYITTSNVSVSGAKIRLQRKYDFPLVHALD